MPRVPTLRILVAVLVAMPVACVTSMSHAPVASPPATMGLHPQLPEAKTTALPTVRVARASPWPRGAQPVPGSALAVDAFARDLVHPRWLYVLPNGDVLVAETNAPERPADGGGIRGFFMRAAMRKAGADTPSADRITLLRDADGDGRAELRSVFASGLHSPFGMALVDSTLYIANTDAVLAFDYRTGQTALTGPGRKLTDLPAGPINHHWTKNIIASPDGRHLYATVGSNSNVGERGIAAEEGRASIWQIDLANGAKRIYGAGLRNPNGMAWEPSTGALWTVVNERDELGDDLVPDYLTSVRDGGFYGWPYSYFGQHVDARMQPPEPALVAGALQPDYALGAHVAALGLASGTAALPLPYREGMFIGEHGSWNRQPGAGYRVVFVPFVDGRPNGLPLTVLSGFVDDHGRAHGRPVGVVIGQDGALLVADDVGNTVWRVAGAP
jgi:glucose/arabinose dehydrogenase